MEIFESDLTFKLKVTTQGSKVSCHFLEKLKIPKKASNEGEKCVPLTLVPKKHHSNLIKEVKEKNNLKDLMNSDRCLLKQIAS